RSNYPFPRDPRAPNSPHRQEYPLRNPGAIPWPRRSASAGPTKGPSDDDSRDHRESAPTPYHIDPVPEQIVLENVGRCPHFGTPPREKLYSGLPLQALEYPQGDFLFSRPRCAWPKARTPSPLRLAAT